MVLEQGKLKINNVIVVKRKGSSNTGMSFVNQKTRISSEYKKYFE